MALTGSINVLTGSIPTVLRAEAHRVDAPYWAVHTVLGWVGYGVMYSVYRAAVAVDEVHALHVDAMSTHPRGHVIVLAAVGVTVVAALIGIAVGQ